MINKFQYWQLYYVVCSSCLLFLIANLSHAMDPDELLVVANSRMAGSVEIAKYYMEKRNIPKSHLLSLSLSLKESISRDEYNRKIKAPVLKALKALLPDERISTVVLIYGVPLKVDPQSPDWSQKEQIRNLSNELIEIDKNEEYLPDEKTIKKKKINHQIDQLLNTSQRAAVDSELALVKVNDYELRSWIRNPYFFGFQGLVMPIKKDEVVLVCRLDGPNKETVYRIIDDTLIAEKNGLQGKAYFDARWKMDKKSELSGYSLYDASLHKAAKLTAKRMEVVLDEKPELFPVDSCPEAALYGGWYSLGKYVDSFEWQKGAIGYHMASAECSTLRKKGSRVWCKKMLEKGVAATIGPVYEPYIQGFPLPEYFFSHLTEGYMSLGESYLVSLPFLSWQMVMVGDPLYQPFKPLKQ